MNLKFFPKLIVEALSVCNVDKLYEIRLREGFPVIVVLDGQKYYLSQNGVTIFDSQAIIATKIHIDEIIGNVTEFSIYAFNDKIKCGFLTTPEGIRIGLAGECVMNKDKVLTIKNFSSLNIRIPHKISGCSNLLMTYIVQGKKVYNTLIISPPFFGKTTTLKDVSENLNKINLGSILIIDERGEFGEIKGQNIDKISFSDKAYAFDYGVRSLSPNVVITDELGGKKDWESIYNASLSGVNVIASCHGFGVDDIIKKEYFIDGIFDRYVVLGDKSSNFIVYDKDRRLL